MSPVAVTPMAVPATDEAPKVEAKAKKPAAKKAVKKATKKARASEAKSNGKARARKAGLRTMQVRALTVLARVESANIQEIAEKSGVGYGMIRIGIGADHPEAREAMEKRQGFPSLITLRLARTDAAAEKEPGVSRFAITTKGRQVLEKHQAEHGKKLPEPAAAPYSKNKKK